jgi:hypothetical protein
MALCRERRDDVKGFTSVARGKGYPERLPKSGAKRVFDHGRSYVVEPRDDLQDVVVSCEGATPRATGWERLLTAYCQAQFVYRSSSGLIWLLPIRYLES